MEENKYGADYVTLTDENGKEEEFEHLATLDYEGETYMALCPADADPDDNEGQLEVVILKVEEDEESGEDMLVTVDDEDLLDRVFEKFVEMSEEEGDDEDEE